MSLIAGPGAAQEEGQARVTLAFSEMSAALLTSRSEEILLSLAYFVAPSPQGQAQADESGMIPLGYDRLQVPAQTGVVTLPQDGLAAIDPALTLGPVLVNANVGSARVSDEDNLLDCDFFEGALQTLRAHTITLHCTLIAEEEAIGDLSGSELVGHDWVVEDVAGRGVPDDVRSSLRFDGEGRMTGEAGCNRIFGSYTLDGSALSVGAIGMTRMLCPEPVMEHEARFTAILESVSTFRIDETGALILEADAATFIVARQATAE
ncbi:META domain-containing protein [Hasllibacter sp. MH4015]|uniref:META domain-containing protein n=1 Tax=Hasllibacter sp. MH4015 TaxID=2854029 RepID=UPI001CD796BF|nr:META domain-containing protein [Hasllibacter sp. MH4015]